MRKYEITVTIIGKMQAPPVHNLFSYRVGRTGACSFRNPLPPHLPHRKTRPLGSTHPRHEVAMLRSGLALLALVAAPIVSPTTVSPTASPTASPTLSPTNAPSAGASSPA